MLFLTEGLSRKGIACDMLCAASSGKTRVTALNSNAKLIATHTWTKKSATMISPAMITMLRKIANDYDIIHVHHPDPMACLALMLSGYKGRVILHWHSDIIKQKKFLKLYEPMQTWLLKRADIIIGTSPVYLKESPCLKDYQEKCVALPIGIEPVKYDNDKAEAIKAQYGNKKIVFSVGRLVPYKGFRHLVRATKMLSDDYVVIIGGTGPLEDELKSLINNLELQDKVHLIGHVDDETLHSYYGACTLFCLPSVQKTEAFGIVQIEAMSCGRPVVTTRIPESGVPWVNEHGVSGLNVEPADSRQLADAIVRITADESTYQHFRNGAMRRYLKVFTDEKMIDDCIAIYNSK